MKDVSKGAKEWRRMNNPLFSIVTGTYNRFEMLADFMRSVREQIPDTIPYEFVICDGGSTDATLPYLRQQTDVVLIEDGELKGAISAFTRAAKRARGQFVLLANDDIVMGEDSILTALVYLQDHLTCGAVAFRDNRPIPGYVDNTNWHTLKMPAVKNGRAVSVIYAQVGLFRAWLGHTFNWWTGAHNEMSASLTYAGDNFLSAKIWQAGYTVDEVEGCYIIDYVADDELRQITLTKQGQTTVSDSDAYYGLWGRDGGPHIPQFQMLQQQDMPSIRVLYLPIYEPGWEVQKTQKHGLRDALMHAKTPNGWGMSVYELDYLAISAKQLEVEIMRVCELWQPRIILTQIQGHLPITPAILAKIRTNYPRASIINWNGDESQGGLITPEMINLLRLVDLQLTVNASTLPVYEQYGIQAAYWQIGYEEPGDDLPDMPAHDVVFLGSFNNPARLPLKTALEELRNEGVNVGIYQPGDASATLYNFAKGVSLYRNSRLSIGSNEYPESRGFFSNRMLQAMSAQGGALYLQQRIHGIQELTGIIPGVHFIEWTDYDDLKAQVRYFLNPANEADRLRISQAGTRFVREYHSFDHRVTELFALMKKHLQPYQDPTVNAVYLKYIGRNKDGFGIPSRTTEGLHYQHIPGRLLLVNKLDAPYMLADPDKLWELVGSE